LDRVLCYSRASLTAILFMLPTQSRSVQLIFFFYKLKYWGRIQRFVSIMDFFVRKQPAKKYSLSFVRKRHLTQVGFFSFRRDTNKMGCTPQITHLCVPGCTKKKDHQMARVWC
jgi:hypothetical protein